MSNIIDGKAFAETLSQKLTDEVKVLKASGLHPGIGVILVGDDPASQVYVGSKVKRCAQLDIVSKEIRLSSEATQEEVLAAVNSFNNDSEVHGILVQLPLPKQIDESAIINAISPAKDVDGFSKVNSGALMAGEASLIPCTPLGSAMLLKDKLGDLSGLHAVVVGRSNIVGKPMAMLLLQENCTVTIAHSRTKNLPEICKQADIIVAAVGRPNFIQGDWIKPGATVIDVGINRITTDEGKNRLVGDVDFDSASKVAGAITPVPGGVGPMTIACLMANTITAAKNTL